MSPTIYCKSGCEECYYDEPTSKWRSVRTGEPCYGYCPRCGTGLKSGGKVVERVDRSVALDALDAVQPLNCAHCCIGDCTPFGDGPDCAERRLAQAERQAQAKGDPHGH